MPTPEETALRRMYYQRMIRAEAALQAFVEDRLTIESARATLFNAQQAALEHLKTFPD